MIAARRRLAALVSITTLLASTASWTTPSPTAKPLPSANAPSQGAGITLQELYQFNWPRRGSALVSVETEGGVVTYRLQLQPPGKNGARQITITQAHLPERAGDAVQRVFQESLLEGVVFTIDSTGDPQTVQFDAARAGNGYAARRERVVENQRALADYRWQTQLTNTQLTKALCDGLKQAWGAWVVAWRRWPIPAGKTQETTRQDPDDKQSHTIRGTHLGPGSMPDSARLEIEDRADSPQLLAANTKQLAWWRTAIGPLDGAKSATKTVLKQVEIGTRSLVPTRATLRETIAITFADGTVKRAIRSTNYRFEWNK